MEDHEVPNDENIGHKASLENELYFIKGAHSEFGRRLTLVETLIRQMPQQIADGISAHSNKINERLERNEAIFEKRTTEQDEKLDKQAALLSKLYWTLIGGGFVVMVIVGLLEASAQGHIWPFSSN